jgi:molecular chaperone DnaK (HSP70)
MYICVRRTTCCMALQVLKARAEAFLSAPADNAVVTIPAHFSPAQRLATMEAAMQAGFVRVALLQVRIAVAGN